jgi:hypothetical protein
MLQVRSLTLCGLHWEVCLPSQELALRNDLLAQASLFGDAQHNLIAVALSTGLGGLYQEPTVPLIDFTIDPASGAVITTSYYDSLQSASLALQTACETLAATPLTNFTLGNPTLAASDRAIACVR